MACASDDPPVSRDKQMLFGLRAAAIDTVLSLLEGADTEERSRQIASTICFDSVQKVLDEFWDSVKVPAAALPLPFVRGRSGFGFGGGGRPTRWLSSRCTLCDRKVPMVL